MQIVTTHLNGAATIKPFAWSYSKLKNFEVCPKRHFHVDIAKDCNDDSSEALLWGNAVHNALARRLDKKTPLPEGMDKYETWCAKAESGGGDLAVELKLAIKKDFGPCDWFAKDTWFRGVADVLKVFNRVALAIDWKTGKILEDSVQLALMSACIFAHYPSVEKLRTEFVWLQHDASSRCDFARTDMPDIWRSIWPRIEALESAHSSQLYPATPGRLCKRWCPVTSCVHHGK